MIGKLVAVKKIIDNKELVYDIEVNTNHNFFANDVLTHNCKSPTSHQGKNLLKLTNDKYKYRIGATGTLLLNDPLDTYVPLKWIGAEKCCYTTFKNFYCNFTGQFHNIVTGFKNTAILKEQLAKYSLRRTKDLLNLPPKNIINEYVDMDEKQAKFYEDIKNGVKEEVDKVELNTTSLLALVTRLRQATACPSILTTTDIESSKIERACDLVDQIISNGDKVVIYSTFKETVRVLAEKLKQYKPLILTGDVKDEDIYKRKNAFQTEPDKKIIICTWQKMGTGITLTAASYAIFIDCAWTAGLNEQSEDRIYRIGTTKPVFIYYLWAKGTIDERVKEILDTKAMLTDYMIDDKVDINVMQKLRDIIIDL